MSLYFKQQPELDSPYDEVEWLDTDASEDEDYLPQFPIQQQQQQQPILPSIKSYFLKRTNTHYNREISGSSFDSNSSIETEDEDDFFDNVLDNKSGRINLDGNNTNNVTCTETPNDKVRQAIDKTIDNGIERVDISHIGLTEIPDDIKELQYVTVVHHEVVKTASLQIFLYGNDLTSINPILFRLKSLTVLSLRNNHLTTIPPDIALLENLVELSLGNNQLKTIPAELTRLEKLKTLSLFPNPFLPLPNDKCHVKRIQQRRTSLTEISTRGLLSSDRDLIQENQSVLPNDIVERFQSISKVNSCEHCRILFHIPDIEEVIWKNILGNHHVPTLYRFCSIRCCNTFSIKESTTNDPTTPAETTTTTTTTTTTSTL